MWPSHSSISHTSLQPDDRISGSGTSNFMKRTRSGCDTKQYSQISSDRMTNQRIAKPRCPKTSINSNHGTLSRYSSNLTNAVLRSVISFNFHGKHKEWMRHKKKKSRISSDSMTNRGIIKIFCIETSIYSNHAILSCYCAKSNICTLVSGSTKIDNRSYWIKNDGVELDTRIE